MVADRKIVLLLLLGFCLFTTAFNRGSQSMVPKLLLLINITWKFINTNSQIPEILQELLNQNPWGWDLKFVFCQILQVLLKHIKV